MHDEFHQSEQAETDGQQEHQTDDALITLSIHYFFNK